MKMGRIQEESNQQVNKGCPARRTPTSEITWAKPTAQNPKLKIQLGIFAFVRTQSGGSAFWCMLGAYFGVVSNQGFNDRSIVGISPANYSTIMLGDLFIVISCPLLNDQPIRVWLCLYWDQTAECDPGNLTFHGFARPSFSEMHLLYESHRTSCNAVDTGKNQKLIMKTRYKSEWLNTRRSLTWCNTKYKLHRYNSVWFHRIQGESNPKLKTHLGIFAFMRTQLCGSAF